MYYHVAIIPTSDNIVQTPMCSFAWQVRKEHETLHTLLIEDTIASVPSFLQAPLYASHAEDPCTTTISVRMRLTAMVKHGMDAANDLWHALVARDHSAVKALHQRLDATQLELCARWRLRDSDGAVMGKDESNAPFGETLAHACAFAGATALLQRLLGTSAKADLARRRGTVSGFTALHSAVAGGHLEVCKLLLEAGAKVSTTSASGRSALWTACVKGRREVALLLAQKGADPYAAPQGSESAIDALRRIGSRASMELHTELAALAHGETQIGFPGAALVLDEGEEGEGEGEEEEDPEENEARKILVAGAPKEVHVPSLHPHALQPCRRHAFCDVRGPGCKMSPTAYTCVECSGWDACYVCFDKAPKEGPELSGTKDSLAELLYEISLATHDEEEGDAAEDDVGDAVVDDDDEDVDMKVLFKEAQSANAQTDQGRNEDDYEEEY